VRSNIFEHFRAAGAKRPSAITAGSSSAGWSRGLDFETLCELVSLSLQTPPKLESVYAERSRRGNASRRQGRP
jgi:hypothetical protein